MKAKQLPWVSLALVLLATRTPADESRSQALEALQEFQKNWKPLTGRQYMRPLGDAGWKARLAALRKLARAGIGSVPVLTDALKRGHDETRVFAAQALYLFPEPAAKATLIEALKDKHPAVRLYALDALSMFGKLPEEEPYLTLWQKDPNRDVRSHAAFALKRDHKPQPKAVRKALCDYDLKNIATAKIGAEAPEFRLTGATGKATRLSDFRSKKLVVLVFVYGDT